MVDLDMRGTFNLALLAIGGSVVAEALASVLICIASRGASEGLVYRFCAWFHGPAEAVRFFFFSRVENHPNLLEDAAMMVAFFGTALLQWFLIFILVLGLARLSLNHCDARRTSIKN